MNAIFAVNAIDGFGKNNDMPWPRSSVDLKRFKFLTSGNTVIMGSGTWNSNMPKPLPGRRNIVISKTLKDDRCEVYPSITDMMMNVQESEKTFVIGGAKLLWAIRPFITKVYLTRFKSSDECDVTLDVNQYLQDFSLEGGEHLADHTFEIFSRCDKISE